MPKATRLGDLFSTEHPDYSVHDQLRHLYGENSRGGPNMQAAADDLGVHPDTVRRWARQDRLPSNANGSGVHRRHSSWEDSPTGRFAVLDTGQAHQLRTQGGKITYAGRVRISGDDRDRQVTFDVSPQRWNEVMEAYARGDDTAALQALEDAWDDETGTEARFSNHKSFEI